MRSEMIETMFVLDGKRYYKTAEVAELSGLNPRTLRRYLAAGKLAHFLFPFQTRITGCRYWRLEEPEETEELLTETPEKIWKLHLNGGDEDGE